MQVNWRELLTSIHVPWKDRGANTTAGNVNIACPWCRDDPSHHLGISENIEAFYCYRNPDRHSGRSFVALLIRLNQTRAEAVRLLNHYRLRSASTPLAPERKADPIQITRAWDRFMPAAGHERTLAYLGRRGFPSPRALCEQYDLRVAYAGTWANRLLIPYVVNRAVVSWSGRAVIDGMIPKYLAQKVEGAGLVYCPDATKPKRDTLVIVEGPLDALKIADACRRMPVIAAALSGKHLPAEKLNLLRGLAGGCSQVLVALDADVSANMAYTYIAEISQALRPPHIGRMKLPLGYKDPGEMPPEGIVEWVAGNRSRLH